ncbi:MAG TPA: ABC transporter permease, partial [Desulfurococcaceae archaeon]|nr:ABC transporter permease [Desulfurococcaceae archaeon]
MNISFLIDALRLALKTLSERRLRAILTIIGIAIGPIALVTMSSVVRGYSNYVTSQLEALGQNLIVVQSTGDYKLSQDDVDALRSIPGVKHAEPFYMTRATVKVGDEDKEIIVYAVPI